MKSRKSSEKTFISRVATLNDEIPLDVKDGRVVVVFNLAKLEEIDAASWSVLSVEINDDVAHRRFKKNRHVLRCD